MAEWQQGGVTQELECPGCHRKVKVTVLWITADEKGLRAYYDCGHGHAIIEPLTMQRFIALGAELSGSVAQLPMEAR